MDKYRIEFRQGDKVFFTGPWAKKMIDLKAEFEDIANDIKLGNEGKLSSIMKADTDGDMVIIPKNILINSLVVLAKENKENDKKKEEDAKEK